MFRLDFKKQKKYIKKDVCVPARSQASTPSRNASKTGSIVNSIIFG